MTFTDSIHCKTGEVNLNSMSMSGAELERHSKEDSRNLSRRNDHSGAKYDVVASFNQTRKIRWLILC